MLVSRTDSSPRSSQFILRINGGISIKSPHHHVIDHAVTLTFMPHTNLSFFVGSIFDLDYRVAFGFTSFMIPDFDAIAFGLDNTSVNYT